MVSEFHHFPEHSLEGLKVQAGVAHPHPKGLPDCFHHQKARDVVQRMVKECGVAAVNVQWPAATGPLVAEDNVVGEPVPHKSGRQRLSLRRWAIRPGPEPHPGVASRIH
nr:hypothetical protein [Arthrobacter sp. CDRTa11]